MNFTPEEKAEQLAWFDSAASVEYNGKKYRLTKAEIGALLSRGTRWHSEGDPSSWLVAALVRKLKNKLQGKLPRAKIIELGALILKSTPERVESSLNWTANYMAFHDGTDPEKEHPYPEDEE